MSFLLRDTQNPQSKLLVFSDQKAVLPLQRTNFSSAEASLALKTGFYIAARVLEKHQRMIESITVMQRDGTDYVGITLMPQIAWNQAIQNKTPQERIQETLTEHFVTSRIPLFEDPDAATIPSQAEVDAFLKDPRYLNDEEHVFFKVTKHGGVLKAIVDQRQRTLTTQFGGVCGSACVEKSVIPTYSNAATAFKKKWPGLQIIHS